MSASNKRSYTKFKIVAKTNLEVKKSLLHHAIKELIRVSKIIKGFLIQKTSRRINEIKEEKVNIEEELQQITLFFDNLKSINHNDIGQLLAGRLLSISSISDYISPLNENQENLIKDKFFTHKRIKQTIELLENKIKKSIEKNNLLRKKEQKKQSNSLKTKGLLSQRRIETVLYFISYQISFALFSAYYNLNTIL